jgi:hypothetical protein
MSASEKSGHSGVPLERANFDPFRSSVAPLARATISEKKHRDRAQDNDRGGEKREPAKRR